MKIFFRKMHIPMHWYTSTPKFITLVLLHQLQDENETKYKCCNYAHISDRAVMLSLYINPLLDVIS